jgi:hypothetical protein
MILYLVNNLAECKYLDCSPLPIDFRRTSNHVPVMGKPIAEVQLARPHGNVIQEIKHLECYFKAKMQARSLDGQLKKTAVHFGLKSTESSAIIDSDSVASVVRPTRAMKYRWVPPSSVHEDDDDYHGSVLREDGYLRVTASWPL